MRAVGQGNLSGVPLVLELSKAISSKAEPEVRPVDAPQRAMTSH